MLIEVLIEFIIDFFANLFASFVKPFKKRRGFEEVKEVYINTQVVSTLRINRRIGKGVEGKVIEVEDKDHLIVEFNETLDRRQKAMSDKMGGFTETVALHKVRLK